MKYTKVTYQKAFVIGPYLQERVGIEIEIDETEQPQDALTEAKRIAETWHIANNPQVHELIPGPFDQLPITISYSEDPEIGITPEVIMSCNDLVTIDSYRLLIKGKQELENAYTKRREELTKLNHK